MHGSAAAPVTPTPTPTPAQITSAAVTQFYFYGSPHSETNDPNVLVRDYKHFGSRYPRIDNTYRDGERILVVVEFDRAVTVTGQPYLDLQVGDQKRRTTYFRRTDPQQLRFHYRVQPEDYDADGISVPADAIHLNGGSIRDGDGVAANLAHNGLPDDATRKAQGTAARGTSPHRNPAAVQVIYYHPHYAPPRNGSAYTDQERILILAEFNRAVTVTGSPYLDLQVGKQLRRATYFRGTGTRQLWFHYRAQSDDYDPDGISVPADAIHLNGGSIRDGDGVAANLAHRGIADHGARRVHGSAAVQLTPTPTPTPSPTPTPTLAATPAPTPTRIVPATVTQLYFYGSPRNGSAYTDQERILITVEFDRGVVAIGPMYLDLQVGDQLRRAEYFRSAHPQQLRFHYRVQPDDYDADGVSVPAGAIRVYDPGYKEDPSVTGVSHSHNGIGADAAHKVQGSAAVQLTPTPSPTLTPTPTLAPTLTPTPTLAPTPALAPTLAPTPVVPSLVINPAGLTLSENTYGTYAVALSTPPARTDTVTVAIAAQRTAPPGAANVGEDNAGGSGGVTVSPSTLTFTSKDWATPQTVTVTAGPDDNVSNDTVVLTHTAAGGSYAGVTGRLTVSVADAGIGNS